MSPETGIAPHHAAAVAAGAECGRCSLHACGAGPVPPTVPPAGRMRLLVVGEGPSPLEVERGETLIGPAGRELRSALEAGGLDPSRAHYTNAILCRPPGGDIKRFVRDAAKMGLASPIDCCRPRLMAEIARADFAVYLGNTAVKAAGVGESALKLRGTPLRDTTPPGLAILHPGFVLQDSGRVLRGVFRFDVAKAVRLAAGGNRWKEPPYYVPNTAAELAAALNSAVFADRSVPTAVDLETDGVDPWTVNIRRIGIGTANAVLIYSPLSVDATWRMPEAERRACVAELAQFFSEARPWDFHNFYGFDSILLRTHGMVVNESNVFDSLIGHHIGPTSELPHRLDFLGSIYTDAPRWKDDVKHSTTRSDAILDKYLSYDIAVTNLSAPHVKKALADSQQTEIYRLDAYLSTIGRSMAQVGIRIDEEQRKRFHYDYTVKAGRLLREFWHAAGKKINPRSTDQLKILFYKDLGLPILEEWETDAGEPSTAEPVLLDFLERGVDERTEAVIHTLLGFRAADKVITTYLDPRLHVDGRLRTTWKVYGTKSGRWSSGDPANLQNVPDELRAMFVPDDGNIFAAADYSALELRILAALAGDAVLIEAFRAFDGKTGPDIHTTNCCAIFKTTPDKVTKEARTFAKRFVYGLGYGAGTPKIFQTMSLLRDDDLKPVFPGLTLSDIEHAYKSWWTAHPAILEYRRKLIAEWRRLGYIATPWHGRRRYFIGGENHEEMYNHPIQGGAADLQNNAVCKLVGAYPFDFAARRGLILQVHDQLVIECREDDGERVKGLIENSMETTIGPMRYPAEAKVGKTWKAVS